MDKRIRNIDKAAYQVLKARATHWYPASPGKWAATPVAPTREPSIFRAV